MRGDERPPSLGGSDPRAHSAVGRVRRRVGVALLVLSALLTVWSLSQRNAGTGMGGEGGAGGAAETAACGSTTTAGATPVTLPREHDDAWHPLVGAIVCFPHALVVTEVYELGRRGALTLADRRLYATGTGLEIDGDALHVVRFAPPAWPTDAWPLPWGLEVGGVRVGDEVRAVAGTLERDAAGTYTVVSSTAPSFEARNPRPSTAPRVGGDLRVAAFNVFNYFTTLGARGARNAHELERQTAKLVATLLALDADVLALMEIENDDGAALAALARALNEALAAAGSTRRYTDARGERAARGGDAIRQAFLFDPLVVEMEALRADLDPIHLRPPQALTLRHDGLPLTIVAVHHRARSSCPTAGDVDAGFGCWNLVRSAQSAAVMRFAERLAELSGSDDVLIVGDLNAHRFEPPLRLFDAPAPSGDRAWEVLTDRVPAEVAYSYVYGGRSSALDHAVASASLGGRIEGVAYWPINADEPPVADYRTRFNPAAAFEKGPYRSSDHDPLVVGVSLSR